MTVVNACTLFNMVVDKEKEMTLVDFRREVTRALLTTNCGRGEPWPSMLEGRPVFLPLVSTRYDRIGHILVKCEKQ
jgi:hypothetical protein